MTQSFQLFIGSNNDTKKVETDIIEEVMSVRHDGFTVYPVMGYWRGLKEDTVVVLVADDSRKVRRTISILKERLQQEAIGFQVVPNMQFA